MIDQGKLSTLLITIGLIVLGVFVADPTLLPRVIPEQFQIYVPIIGAILLAVYNYIKPRNPEPVEDGA
jgi:uncharacterized membrane-anchored protein